MDESWCNSCCPLAQLNCFGFAHGSPNVYPTSGNSSVGLNLMNACCDLCHGLVCGVVANQSELFRMCSDCLACSWFSFSSCCDRRSWTVELRNRLSNSSAVTPLTFSSNPVSLSQKFKLKRSSSPSSKSRRSVTLGRFSLKVSALLCSIFSCLGSGDSRSPYFVYYRILF